ncbi:MAG: hypothetical protein IT569_09665 [Leptospiraceae bacterium]|nr:hypothetical protein [Leptospiraceae bacterium]
MNQEDLFGLSSNFMINSSLVAMKQGLLIKHRPDTSATIPLTSEPTKFSKNLKLIKRGEGPKVNSGIVVGTVRMGYGHHRMAYSVYTHALDKKKEIHLHDLVAIESREANIVREVDSVYSSFSRYASDLGGTVEWAWGLLTSQGNIYSLQFSTMLAKDLKNLLKDVSFNLPYISTYPLNGQIAASCGFDKIVHLVPDNFPQFYLLVPKAMNLVQSPSSYMKFIDMGVPKENLAVAGHWVSLDVAANAVKDSERRIKRIQKKNPKRLVLPIGGAGAQKKYILEFLKELVPKLQNKEIYLFLNAGDHKDFFDTLREFFEKSKIEIEMLNDTDSLSKFCKKNDLTESEKNLKPVTLFYFENYFDAFSATDRLIRISDVLVTKPSELAFYPIPKIFIRRVGDHEAQSVFRSIELGEGTTECREVSHAMDMVKLLCEEKDLALRMNECVIRNSNNRIYDGAKFALEMSLSMS